MNKTINELLDILSGYLVKLDVKPDFEEMTSYFDSKNVSEIEIDIMSGIMSVIMERQDLSLSQEIRKRIVEKKRGLN
jgi:hypothetical protein